MEMAENRRKNVANFFGMWMLKMMVPLSLFAARIHFFQIRQEVDVGGGGDCYCGGGDVMGQIGVHTDG